jgi:hypothetical protein
MSLKTSSGPTSFPRPDEENDQRGCADDGGYDGDPTQSGDHQA